MDTTHDGKVLLDGFAAWVAALVVPEVVVRSRKTGNATAVAAASAAGTSKPRSDQVVRGGLSKFDDLELQFKDIAASGAALEEVWKAVDVNGNGALSLAEITKFVASNFPLLNHNPALQRAYKAAIAGGNPDAWVTRHEFKSFLLFLLYFCKIFDKFVILDSNDDRRLSNDEFSAASKILGLGLSPIQLKAEFSQLDRDGSGFIPFDDFCEWVARKNCGPLLPPRVETAPLTNATGQRLSQSKPTGSGIPSRTIATLDQVEAEVKQLAAAPKELHRVWTALDTNGNGYVSLADVEVFIAKKYPVLNHRAALLRAYKATMQRASNGDDWVERNEFRDLFVNTTYFNKLFAVFDGAETDKERRITYRELVHGLGKMSMLGKSVSESEAKASFDKMDPLHQGVVPFDELCVWVASVECPGTNMRAKKLAASPSKATVAPGTGATAALMSDPKLIELEKSFRAACKAQAQLQMLWKSLDASSNGSVTVPEIDKWIADKYPVLGSKPALAEAYRATLNPCQDSLTVAEFPSLLANVLFFNKAWKLFSRMDANYDRRLDVGEFKRGAMFMGLWLSPEDASAEFAKIDVHKGGFVLFGDFCKWFAQKFMPEAFQ